QLCLAGLRNGVAIALGNRLVFWQDEGQPRLTRVELPGQVTGLVPALPHTRQGVLALLEQGAALRWMGTEAVLQIEPDLASPLGAFVPGGPLVLVSGRQMVLL